MRVNARTRLSLVGRMGLAVCVVGVVAVVLLTPVVLAGGVVSLAAAMVAVGWLPLGDVFVWQVLWTHRTATVTVGGVLTFGGLVIPTAVREIRVFRRHLAGETTPAGDSQQVVDELASALAQQADVPTPDVHVMCETEPRSYAFGRAEHGTIIVTTALVSTLSREELNAVLAHELSHLLNGDSRIVEAVLVPILIAQDVDTTVRRLSVRLRNLATGLLGFAALFVGVVLALLVVLVSGVGAVATLAAAWAGSLLYLSLGALAVVLPRLLLWLAKYVVALLSRGREFAADDGAVALTGDPAALAGALRGLTDARERPDIDKRSWMRARSTLDILPATEAFARGPLRTHPTVERRLERLERHAEGLETRS